MKRLKLTLALLAIGAVAGAVGATYQGRALAQAAVQSVALSLSSITTSGNATVGGTLSVTGASTFGGALALGTNGITTTGTVNAGAGGFQGNSLTRANAVTTNVTGGGVDGASAVGVSIGSGLAYANATAKLVSVQNNGTEKAFFDKDGNIRLAHLSCAMSAGTTCTATVPTGSVCLCGATAGTASAVSCAVSSTTATCTASASNSSTWNVLVW